MATRTVKPSGGDYTSLSAWEAARQADLTGLGPEIVECSGNLSDTTQVTVDGWTTTATDYIQIITPQADRHAGVWSTSKYRLEVSLTFSRVLQIYENHVRVEGLQVRQTSASADAWASVFVGSIDGPTLIDACLVRCASTNASQGHGIHVLDNTTSSAVTTIRNTIVYGIAAGAGVYMSNGTADPVTNIDNCTLIGATYGIHRVFATVTVRNTYAHGATNAYTGTMTLSNCAHSSATVFTGSTASIAHSTANFTNVTGGSENYHLVAGASTVLRHNGENLSSSFTKDIDGQTRDHWSIGADEPFAANTVIRYVNTGSSSGGDGTTNATSGANRAYVSLSAALAAQVTARTGLVANDEVLEIHCCGSAADATGVTVQTFVTDATRYVHIKGHQFHANGRHAGVWSTSKYRIELAVDSSAVLLNAVPWTRVTGIQMRNSHVDSWYAFRDNNPTGSTSVYLDSCIMRCLSNSYTCFNPGASGTNALHCRNCIVTEGRDGFVSDGGTDMLVLENCVAVACTGAGFLGNGLKATNCYGGGCGEDYALGYTMSLTNCYSEDGTQSTTVVAYSTSAGAYFRNVTAGSEDLHIGALSSLRGAGADLSASFKFDIDNEARIAWDVGVDAYNSFIQRNQATVTTGSATINFDANITAGSTLFVACSASVAENTSVTSLSSSPSNTWVLVDRIVTADLAPRELSLWRAVNAASGATGVTPTVSGTLDAVRMWIAEYSDGSLVADQYAEATGASTTPSSGATGTTTEAVELVLGVFTAEYDGHTFTPPGWPWTDRSELNGERLSVIEQRATTVGTFTATGTYAPTVGWAAMCATFKVYVVVVNDALIVIRRA